MPFLDRPRSEITERVRSAAAGMVDGHDSQFQKNECFKPESFGRLIGLQNDVPPVGDALGRTEGDAPAVVLGGEALKLMRLAVYRIRQIPHTWPSTLERGEFREILEGSFVCPDEAVPGNGFVRHPNRFPRTKNLVQKTSRRTVVTCELAT